MNYLAVYSSLIARAQQRTHQTEYTESHHIVPRSMGGTDEPSNLVRLTIREHFLAHLLLAHAPNMHTQWFSVQVMLQDALNPRSPRYKLLSWKPWLRRHVTLAQALQRAQRAAQRSQHPKRIEQLRTLVQRYEQRLAELWDSPVAEMR